MSKIICSAPYCDVSSLQLLTEQSYEMLDNLKLRRITHNSHGLFVFDDFKELNTIVHYLGSNNDVSVIVLYSSLASVLQAAISQKIDLTHAITQWCRFSKDVVFLYKRFRSRVTVINVHQASCNRQGFNSLVGTDLAESLSPLKVDSFFDITAQLLEKQDATIKNSIATLDAITSSLEANAVSEAFDIQAALIQWHDHHLELTAEKDAISLELEKAKSSSKDLAEENELILCQLHRVQDAFEQLYTENVELSKNVEQHKQVTSSAPALAPSKDPVNASISNEVGLLQKIKKNISDAKSASLIEKSELFDGEWYLKCNPDIAKVTKFKKRPSLHYLLYGGFEGRNPSVHFDSSAYLGAYPDVYQESINPLLHYILHGKREGRDPKPWF